MFIKVVNNLNIYAIRVVELTLFIINKISNVRDQHTEIEQNICKVLLV